MRVRRIVICGLPGSAIFFPHYLINDTITEKKLLNAKYAFLFSLQFFSERFLIIRTTEIYDKNEYLSSCKVPVNLLAPELFF